MSSEETAWQPIETAPRDGTEVILAAPKHSGGHWVHVGWWEKGDNYPWRFIDAFDVTPTGCCDRESSDRVPANGFLEGAVSHWMPLPAAPGASS